MKISDEKSHFFKLDIEFLGHIIKHGRITVDPEKIATIRDYESPKTLKQLRSFLGLARYYRKFIQDFAKITKPLTIHLRGENSQVKAKKSNKILINLDQAALDAFEKIKNLLQENVELYQPDFNKPFELTTDASNYALGWKNFIAEYGAKLKYKPGNENIVADAHSRHHQINVTQSGDTIHSIDSSPIEKIKRVHFPLNRFKNQIEII